MKHEICYRCKGKGTAEYDYGNRHKSEWRETTCETCNGRGYIVVDDNPPSSYLSHLTHDQEIAVSIAVVSITDQLKQLRNELAEGKHLRVDVIERLDKLLTDYSKYQRFTS